MNSYVKLNNFLTEYTERNTDNQYKPVAVGRYGIRTRESIYSKELAKDYSKNKVIGNNTLTVGMGSVQIDIGILTEDVKYSVSPAYHTYKIAGINPDYLRYCLECRNQDMFERYVMRGIRQGKTIDLGRWLTYEIPVCEAQEQKEIVSKLDHVDSLITARCEQLAKLDELVKSRFIEMFGDPITNSKCLPTNNLGKVLLLKAGDFTAASDIASEPTAENIYPCYGGNGIRGYVAEYNQEGSYSLIGRQGALSGNVQYATGKFKNTEHALLVTPLIEMNSIWLNHLLINLDLQRYQTGAAQPGLSVKNLQEIPIIEVPKEDQNQFATFVEQTDKSKFEIQQSLEKLETLKKALMQKYFG